MAIISKPKTTKTQPNINLGLAWHDYFADYTTSWPHRQSPSTRKNEPQPEVGFDTMIDVALPEIFWLKIFDPNFFLPHLTKKNIISTLLFSLGGGHLPSPWVKSIKFFRPRIFLHNICTIFAQYLYNICIIFAHYKTIFIQWPKQIFHNIYSTFSKQCRGHNIWAIFTQDYHNICEIFVQYYTILEQYLIQ